MGVLRAHHAHMKLIGKGDVVGEAPLTQQQWLIFKSWERAANDFSAACRVLKAL
jgi:hypothetical protein